MKYLICILFLFSFSLENRSSDNLYFGKPFNKFIITQRYSNSHRANDIYSSEKIVRSLEYCVIKKIVTPDWQYLVKSDLSPPGRSWTPLVECHSDQFIYLYTHVVTDLKIGNSIFKNMPIGKILHSGNSTGPHLHLEILSKQNKIPIDIYYFLLYQ